MVQERRCPVNHEAAINNVIRQCPFLASVSATEGTAQAARFVLNPLKASSDVNAEWTPIFPENELASMDAAFELIHSDSGILPLKDAPTRNVTGCPFHATASPAHEFVTLQSAKSVQMPVEQPFAGLPVASMSLSGPFGFLPNPAEFFRQRRKPKSRSQPKSSGNNNKPGSSNNSNTGKGPKTRSSNSTHKPSATMSQTANNPSLNNTPPSNSSSPRNIHSFLGPMSALLPVAASGRLQCPPAIVAMRAAVARLQPVRDLRPRGLPVRSFALAGTAIIANVPCGMWREHTKKFSFEWFVAVHATIPFITMLRKAVLMPPWAFLLTVAGSVAGQQVGAVLEKRRIAYVQENYAENERNNTTTMKSKQHRSGFWKSLDDIAAMNTNGDSRSTNTSRVFPMAASVSGPRSAGLA